MRTKHGTALVLLIGIMIGVGGKTVTDRLTRTNNGDIHTAKVSAHEALKNPVEVVMLGDSLTHWGEWSELLPGRSIANRGIAGNKISQIASRLDAVYQLHPKKVFLMMGTNDLYKVADVSTVSDHYIKVVKDIRAHGIEPVIQSTPLAGPQYSDAVEYNKHVTTLNETLMNFAQRQGIAFVDLNAVMPDTGAHRVKDGIHVNGTAYLKWASTIEPYLQR